LNRFPSILDQHVKDTNENAIHYAISNQCYHVIEFLYNTMPNHKINDGDRDGNTPLHLACANDKHFKVIKFLLDCPGIIINKKNYKGMTPFHLACRKKSNKNIQYLLTYPGIDIDTIDCKGNTIPNSNVNDYYLDNCNRMIEVVDTKATIEMLLGREQKISINMKIFTKNYQGYTVSALALYHWKNAKNREEVLKFQHWEEVIAILLSFLAKGRYDYFKFLMESFTAQSH
jgi:hypothetical protein